ncbi:MAG: hypothetical protein RLZZ283_417 [Candidatus Parcubacteria bacterium]|jgi:hypothetical protein
MLSKLFEGFRRIQDEARAANDRKHLAAIRSMAWIPASTAAFKLFSKSTDKNRAISRAEHVKLVASDIARSGRMITPDLAYSIAMSASREVEGHTFAEDLTEDKMRAGIAELKTELGKNKGR